MAPQVLPIEGVKEQRSLTFGRPSPHAMGLLRQSALVDEDERAPFAPGFFFSAGQSLRFHWAIAGSSRSKARPTGFWQLQPRRWRSNRNTLVEWPRTPKRSRSTLATRSRVQIGVGKPAASGPATRTS